MEHQYNDNELLYLMYEGNDDATKILYHKYYRLINSRLRRFNIKPQNFDDFFQEGLMALHEAINIYNPYLSKTFNKFFDMVLQRRIMNVLRKEKNYFFTVSVVDDLSYYVNEDANQYDVDDYDNIFNGFEKDVFILRFHKNFKPQEIADELHCSVKKVYNTIYLIRQKIRKLENKD
ncbi:MAG TPA: sigma-70 family RNA polymerase sigma factor [Bacilli bacterium]